MDYKIPEDIITKIPQYFWPAFAGELVSTLGMVVFQKDEYGQYGLNFVSGTFGWNAALRMTCKKLNMKWLFNYYDKLEWWQSDMFDGEIEDSRTGQMESKADHDRAGAEGQYVRCGS